MYEHDILPSILAASDGFDLQQIIFVVVFLVIAFVQWLFKLIKEKANTANREKQLPPTSEEIEARRKAWEKQTAPPTRVEKPEAPPPMPGGLGDILETLRKNLEEQTRPAPSAPSAPPPLPAKQAVQPAPVSVRVVSDEPATAHQSFDSHSLLGSNPVSLTTATARTSVRPSHSAHPIAEFLRSTHGYRRAFILKEVLSAPKALQSSPWPNDS